MAQLHFTSWLRELVPDGPLSAGGDTVGDALRQVFAERPHVRSYVLDRRGATHQHVCIFTRWRAAQTWRGALSRSIKLNSTLYVNAGAVRRLAHDPESGYRFSRVRSCARRIFHVRSRAGVDAQGPDHAGAQNGGWAIARTDFPGVAVTAARCTTARDGTLYAVLKHGHFGTKLHRSSDDGAGWQELAAPAPRPTPQAARRCARSGHWRLAAPVRRPAVGRRASGRQFRSDDRGERWQLTGAVEMPGARMVSAAALARRRRHPPHLARSAHSARLFVAISCGGIGWESGGAPSRAWSTLRRRSWSPAYGRRNLPARA